MNYCVTFPASKVSIKVIAKNPKQARTKAIVMALDPEKINERSKFSVRRLTPTEEALL